MRIVNSPGLLAQAVPHNSAVHPSVPRFHDETEVCCPQDRSWQDLRTPSDTPAARSANDYAAPAATLWPLQEHAAAAAAVAAKSF
jgi:hypothetical protein